MIAVPRGPADLTPAWVGAALEAWRPGAASGLEAISRERIGESAGIIADLYRLTLTYGLDGARGPARLVAKLPSSRPDTRRLAVDYGLYEREVCFYRDIATTQSLRVPRPYFAEIDRATGDFAILMEDLWPARSVDQVRGVTVPEALAILDTLATFQALWYDRPELAGLAAVVPPWTDPPYDREAAVFDELWPIAEHFFAARGFAPLARIGMPFSRAIKRLQVALSEPPRTLCHGDLRPDNLMVLPGTEPPAIAIIDWQIANQGRPAGDVGYLLGNHMDTATRRRTGASLLRHYHDRLLEGGVEGYDAAACALDYRRSALFGLAYLVNAIGVHDPGNPRLVTVLDLWSRRLAAAIDDLDLVDLID